MAMSIIEKFIRSLEDHVEMYETLAAHIAAEQDYISEGDDDTAFIYSMLRAEAAEELQDNAHLFIMALKDTAWMLGLPDSGAPLLTDVAEALPAPFGDRIRRGARRLESLKNLLRREDESGSYFIEEALRLTNEYLHCFRQTGLNAHGKASPSAAALS
ncbi:hypothetical protein C4J81_17660 [Deltaproteobacteria bacterium Smac51]|nr:hypothetical protein C4J81_17660 [Deltaproteobacteria bacterium Smac51]